MYVDPTVSRHEIGMQTQKQYHVRSVLCLNSVLNVEALVGAFNQEKALVGAFSVITNLRMDLFQALVLSVCLLQTQIIRVEEEKEKVESELLRQARDLEMLQNTIQKSQRERENMQSEMEVLLDRINKMSDMLDKSRVQRS